MYHSFNASARELTSYEISCSIHSDIFFFNVEATYHYTELHTKNKNNSKEHLAQNNLKH